MEVELKLYHVTPAFKVSSIRSLGLVPGDGSNWTNGRGEAYGAGYVHAFEDKRDAILWAAKMDWAQYQRTGTGRISVIEFDDEEDGWEEDLNDPLSRSGSSGRWLRKKGPVGPERFADATSTRVRTPLIRAVIQERRRHGEEKTEQLASG